MRAWHFLPTDRCLTNDDGRLVEVGKTYECDGDVVLCYNGMHGSVKPLDALSHAPGPVICRVNITGGVVRGDDKLVGRRREVLWMYDATNVLREFARMCALDVVSLWNAPDVVVEYLRTGDEGLRAAARAAAWAAAWDAAWAAREAAGEAAGDAARAAREKQNRRLYRMLTDGRSGK